MKITEHEMRGMLTGRCIAGDMRVNEQLAPYLVRKFSEQQQKLDAVLAENVALKSPELQEFLRLVECMNDDHCDGNYGDSHEWIRHIVARQNEYEEKFGDTPWGVVRGSKYLATDAILNAVRAEGMDIAANFLIKADTVGSTGAMGHALHSLSLELRAETTSSQYESLAGGK